MEQHVISLTRQNLHELEAVERLAQALGAEAFLALAQNLASAYTIDPGECRQSIHRRWTEGLIGMSDVPFFALQQVCESLIEREPRLLEKLTYRSRDSRKTVLSHGLWLQIVACAQQGMSFAETKGLQGVVERSMAYANAAYPDIPANDPATFTAEFMLAREAEGMTTRQALEALIAHKKAE